MSGYRILWVVWHKGLSLLRELIISSSKKDVNGYWRRKGMFNQKKIKDYWRTLKQVKFGWMRCGMFYFNLKEKDLLLFFPLVIRNWKKKKKPNFLSQVHLISKWSSAMNFGEFFWNCVIYQVDPSETVKYSLKNLLKIASHCLGRMKSILPQSVVLQSKIEKKLVYPLPVFHLWK